MPWNLSGWSPGRGRTPLTYNLRAGQFRGMGRPRFFPSTTIINNNIFGNMRSGCCNSYSNFYNSGCCGGQNTTPEWMQWTMIGGMGLSALGEILGIFWPGKKSADVAEEAPADKKPAEDPYAKDWTELQNLYKDKGTFAHIGDKYICLLTNGKQIEATTPSDLMGKLQLELAPVNRSNNVVASSATVTVGSKESFKELFSASYVDASGNYDLAQGLKVNGKYYTNVAEAYTAYAETNKPVKASDISGTSITITDVIDNSSTIGDFTGLSVSVNKNDLEKNKEITIGSHSYIVVETKSGYIILKDKDPTRNPGTDQTYILEVTSDGTKYQLHQRENAAVSGYGVSAHS